jgi:methyltransferase-like protein/2-polyprenyl-3-methyl-5-hydroxy-6-metoxy-1,4-benzoquinol methylase
VNNANPYDEVEYPGFPFPQTHPDRLATIATLFGMTPAPVNHCRVLELGCGDGGNLIPMAYGLPESQFIGIDLAARAVEKGQTAVAALGLRNIELRRLNVHDVTADFGQFDYIIAHGLFSWVPPDVKDKILAICKANLASRGVAFISYNTYPGGHLHQMTREMMLFHLNGQADFRTRISQGREVIKLMSDTPSDNDGYSAFLKQELERVLERADTVLYHDDLAETNAPLYFYQFVEQSRRHGLQYLAEARLAESQSNLYPTISAEMGATHEDPLIAREQYFDFLKCRMFRQTLLCHGDVQVDRSIKIDRLRNLFVASSARPVSLNPDLVSSGTIEQFRLSNGATISIDLPVAKAALSYLGEMWPRSVWFGELVARVSPGSATGSEGGYGNRAAIGLYEAILKIYGADLLELHVHQPGLVATAGEFPMVSLLARLQAHMSHSVTTLRHTTVDLTDDLGRRLVVLLDGTRNRSTLLKQLIAEAELAESSGTPTINREDLDQKLEELARLALLVA